MDVQYPFATDLARLQLLYRLPTSPAPHRLLVLTVDGEALPMADHWPGPVQQLALSALCLPPGLGTARFDAVALPGTLALRRARPPGPPLVNNAGLMKAVAGLLVPGGVIVGHLDHGWALRNLRRPGAAWALLLARLTPGSITGPARCLHALAGAGFEAGQCFYVQPSIAAPMALVPCRPAAARAHFLRAVRSSRPHCSGLGYAARLLLAWAGLGGIFQQQLFFWARKPC